MSTVQFGYGGVPGCCVDPVCGYQMLSSYFYVSQVSRQTYIKTMQPRPFEEWIEKGHQRDAKLCGAHACPTNGRSLVRGGKGYNQGFFVYFAKVWVDVESPSLALLTKRRARDLRLYYSWNEKLSGIFAESATLRANRRFRRRAPVMIEGGSPNQMVFNWERGHWGCWSEGSRGGEGWWKNIANRNPPRGGGFCRSNYWA